MWKFILVIAFICTMDTDAANKKQKRYAGGYAGGGYGGAYAGGFAGASSGAGSFAGSGDYGSYAGTGFDYAPGFGFGFIDPYEFHQRLTAQILAQHAAQNNALTSTYSSGDAFVSADASSYPDDDDDNRIYQQQLAHQQALFDAIRRQAQYNKGYKNNRYAPSYASASGSIGPGGYHQTAQINPENPGSPNIVNRFAPSSGSGGYKGVSVSSFSSSSDKDGKRTSHRGAQTTINDNGKVTTYSVHS